MKWGSKEQREGETWEELPNDSEDAVAGFIRAFDTECLQQVEIGEIFAAAVVPHLFLLLLLLRFAICS